MCSKSRQRKSVRLPRATGAADVGRSNAIGVVEGASARDRGMVSNAEIGSTRGKSRSASVFDGCMRLESTDVSDVAKRKTVRRSTDAEIGKGVSNLRSVGCSMFDGQMMVESTREYRLCASP